MTSTQGKLFLKIEFMYHWQKTRNFLILFSNLKLLFSSLFSRVFFSFANIESIFKIFVNFVFLCQWQMKSLKEQIIGQAISNHWTNHWHALFRFEQTSVGSGSCKEKHVAKGECYGGLARMYQAIKDIRGKDDHHTLLLNAGDMYQVSQKRVT